MSLVDYNTDRAELLGHLVSVEGIIYAQNEWVVLSDEGFQLQTL